MPQVLATILLKATATVSPLKTLNKGQLQTCCKSWQHAFGSCQMISVVLNTLKAEGVVKYYCLSGQQCWRMLTQERYDHFQYVLNNNRKAPWQWHDNITKYILSTILKLLSLNLSFDVNHRVHKVTKDNQIRQPYTHLTHFSAGTSCTDNGFLCEKHTIDIFYCLLRCS